MMQPSADFARIHAQAARLRAEAKAAFAASLFAWVKRAFAHEAAASLHVKQA